MQILRLRRRALNLYRYSPTWKLLTVVCTNSVGDTLMKSTSTSEILSMSNRKRTTVGVMGSICELNVEASSLRLMLSMSITISIPMDGGSIKNATSSIFWDPSRLW